MTSRPQFWLLNERYYDLTPYFDSHPAGAHALRQTAGRDITELFTSLHLSDVPWKLLPRFEVTDPELLKLAEAQHIPRTGYSMKEDGFYMTLRKRVLRLIRTELCEGASGLAESEPITPAEKLVAEDNGLLASGLRNRRGGSGKESSQQKGTDSSDVVDATVDDGVSTTSSSGSSSPKNDGSAPPDIDIDPPRSSAQGDDFVLTKESRRQIRGRVTKATTHYKLETCLAMAYYIVAVAFACFFSHEFCTGYFYGGERSSAGSSPEFIKVVLFFALLWSIFYVRVMMYGIGHEGIHRNLVSDADKRHKSFSMNSVLADFFAEGLGFEQNFWIEEHCMQHHIVTGRYGPDPDEDLPFLRLNAYQEWLWFMHPLNVLSQTVASTLVLPVNMLARSVDSSIIITGDCLRWCGILRPRSAPSFQPGREMERIKPEWGVSGPLELVWNIAKLLLKQSALNLLPFIVVAARNHLGLVNLIDLPILNLTASAIFGAVSSGPEPTAAPDGQQSQIPYAGAWMVYAVVTTWSNCVALHAFHSNHNVEEAKNYEDEKRSPYYPGIDWGEAQVNATVNFRKHWFWPDSGLEHQIEHHLFPTLSISHVDRLAPLVKQTAAEFDVPYNEAPSLFTALGWHFKYMVKLGAGFRPLAKESQKQPSPSS